MRITLVVFIFFNLFLVPAFCKEAKGISQKDLGKKEVSSGAKNDAWEDFKTSLVWAGKASYEQFTVPSNMYNLTVGGAFLGYAFDQDDRILRRHGRKKDKAIFDIADTIGVAGNSPLLPTAFYTYGRYIKSEKWKQFGMETLAAMALTTAEVITLSLIPIHRRPDESDLSDWETKFRGDYSFPSGHVVPAMIISFKTFQFFGPAYTTIPFIFTAIISYERIQSRKHYASDVVGSLVLSAMASEGVRKVANYKGNHPLYKKWYEGELTILPKIFKNYYALDIGLSY